MRGTAFGFLEKRARKWIVKSEPLSSVTGIVKLGNELMFFSHLLLHWKVLSANEILVVDGRVCTNRIRSPNAS